MTSLFTLRCNLRAAGYRPIPVNGKRPSVQGWQHINASEEDIRTWEREHRHASNTGVLTKLAPAFDIDILSEDAAEAVERLVRDRYEEAGTVLIRIGLPPKRAVLFRTDAPFRKITVNLIAPNGDGDQKVELLGDGQQLVIAGTHPKTRKPYVWFGGEPGVVKRDALPYITEEQARRLVEDAAELLCHNFGYRRPANRPREANGEPGGADDWAYLYDNIRHGRALHDSLRDLAAKMVRSGMSGGATVNSLRALMDKADCARDIRWQARRDDIPRLVDSATGKFRDDAPQLASEATLAAATIDQTLDVFDKWLALPDKTPIYATLGAVAANYLEGDPVWLGLIGPPSSAKTEILNSTSLLPHVVQAATVTVAGLLSGTPKKQTQKGAQGGLLRQIGDFGIVALKDFGSILSLHTETKAEVLAALREVFDGAWTRHLGTDGGRTLAWKGKVGLIFAATGVIDSHYSVIGSMGDRFLLSRLAPVGRGQFARALRHVGAGSGLMRKELADAVAALFAGRCAEPRKISEAEIKRIDDAIMLAVRLRGAVARDRQSREIEAVYGAEGTARIGLALERLLAGLDTLGVARQTALKVIESVALDSVPPSRRQAYEYLRDLRGQEATTPNIAKHMALPTVTVRRVLEELIAYRLASRTSQGQGKPDLWRWIDWEFEHPLDDPKNDEEAA